MSTNKEAFRVGMVWLLTHLELKVIYSDTDNHVRFHIGRLYIYKKERTLGGLGGDGIGSDRVR